MQKLIFDNQFWIDRIKENCRKSVIKKKEVEILTIRINEQIINDKSIREQIKAGNENREHKRIGSTS